MSKESIISSFISNENGVCCNLISNDPFQLYITCPSSWGMYKIWLKLITIFSSRGKMQYHLIWIFRSRARFLSLAQSKLRLCSANHRPGCWSNLPCDWPSTAWAYSEQETENRPWILGEMVPRSSAVTVSTSLTWNRHQLLSLWYFVLGWFIDGTVRPRHSTVNHNILNHEGGNHTSNSQKTPWPFLDIKKIFSHIDGLAQERHNSSALAMELRLSCTSPLIWGFPC